MSFPFEICKSPLTFEQAIGISERSERMYALAMLGKGFDVFYQPCIINATLPDGSIGHTEPDFFVCPQGRPFAEGYFVEVTIGNGKSKRKHRQEATLKAADAPYILLTDALLCALRQESLPTSHDRYEQARKNDAEGPYQRTNSFSQKKGVTTYKQVKREVFTPDELRNRRRL